MLVKIKQNRFTIPVLIFCIAFLARIIFYWIVKFNSPDMWNAKMIHINGWLDIAENLVAGAGYSEQKLLTYFPLSHLVPTASRGPLPVFILALLVSLFKTHYLWPLFLYSWALSAFSAVALYFLSRKIFQSENLAACTALIYCFYFPEMSISTTYAAASESLFTLLLLGYFFAVIRNLEIKNPSSSFVCGSLLGLAFLCRPVVLIFIFIHAVWIWKTQRHKAFSNIISFLAAFLICISPWVIRNQIVFHKPIFTTTLGGYNLLRHNGMIEQNKFQLVTHEQFEPAARQLIAKSNYDWDHLSEVQLDGIFKQEARRIIRAYPLRYLKLCGIRLIWLWYKIGAQKPVYLIQNLFIYLFMFPGLFLAFRHRTLGMFAVYMGAFVVMHVLINAQFRFICPLMPYGILIAVYAGTLFRGKLENSEPLL